MLMFEWLNKKIIKKTKLYCKCGNEKEEYAGNWCECCRTLRVDAKYVTVDGITKSLSQTIYALFEEFEEERITREQFCCFRDKILKKQYKNKMNQGKKGHRVNMKLLKKLGDC